MTDQPFAPATLLVQGGIQRSQFGETAEALFLTSGFVYASAEQAEETCEGKNDRYQYSRFANPTVSMLEERLALLEGAEACRVAATGMAAVNAALFAAVKSGDRVVAARALFGGCHWIVSTLLPRFGVETEFVDGTDAAGWAAALSRPAKLVLIETPTNPMLEIIDLRMVARLAHQAGALLVVDNVFATPLSQQPLTFGADVVVYSATKHFDGQGRVMGGAVLGRKAWIEETLHPYLRNTGASLSPFNAWVLLKGLETLELRVRAGEKAAAGIADFLAGRPEIARVWYPFRADHPGVALARQQMRGSGTVVTFAVKGGKAAAYRMLNALRLIAISNNLGDTKSLATHPATTTHLKLGERERARIGITDAVIRLSVGLEDLADLQADLGQALAAGRSERAAA